MNLQSIDSLPADDSVNWEHLSHRCLGRIDLMKKALSRFLETMRSDLRELEAAAAAYNRHEIARLAHRIKGTSLTVSAERLSQHALELETKADQLPDEVDQCLAEIREECRLLSEQIAQRFEEVGQ